MVDPHKICTVPLHRSLSRSVARCRVFCLQHNVLDGRWQQSAWNHLNKYHVTPHADIMGSVALFSISCNKHSERRRRRRYLQEVANQLFILQQQNVIIIISSIYQLFYYLSNVTCSEETSRMSHLPISGETGLYEKITILAVFGFRQIL